MKPSLPKINSFGYLNFSLKKKLKTNDLFKNEINKTFYFYLHSRLEKNRLLYFLLLRANTLQKFQNKKTVKLKKHIHFYTLS